MVLKFAFQPHPGTGKVKVEVRRRQILDFRLEAGQIDVGHLPYN